MKGARGINLELEVKGLPVENELSSGANWLSWACYVNVFIDSRDSLGRIQRVLLSRLAMLSLIAPWLQIQRLTLANTRAANHSLFVRFNRESVTLQAIGLVTGIDDTTRNDDFLTSVSYSSSPFVGKDVGHPSSPCQRKTGPFNQGCCAVNSLGRSLLLCWCDQLGFLSLEHGATDAAENLPGSRLSGFRRTVWSGAFSN